MLILELHDIRSIIHQIGLLNFYLRLFDTLTEDFSNWLQFQKSSRHAVYMPNGVIELMPICNNELYSFKYVNGHPENSKNNYLTVVAFGMLADVKNGYPLLISSMTELTALRTAATAALASKYLAKKNSQRLAIIGCGAQSEFQVLAHQALFDLTEVRYFDPDQKAMQRFAKNLTKYNFKLSPMTDILSAIDGVDIIITATAAPGKQKLFALEHLTPGQHINGIGGDSPNKTELDPKILTQATVVVEYFPQTQHEGEIQNLGVKAKDYVYAELWEIISQQKPGRTNDQMITLFDSVGFALEDFSILRLCYQLAQQLQIGTDIRLIPNELVDSKNLFSLLNGDLT